MHTWVSAAGCNASLWLPVANSHVARYLTPRHNSSCRSFLPPVEFRERAEKLASTARSDAWKNAETAHVLVAVILHPLRPNSRGAVDPSKYPGREHREYIDPQYFLEWNEDCKCEHAKINARRRVLSPDLVTRRIYFLLYQFRDIAIKINDLFPR